MNQYEWDVDAPQTNQYWDVLMERKYHFENIPTTTTTTNNYTRELNMYLPWFRMIETCDKVDATSATNWVGASQENDFPVLTITSDDATSADSEQVQFDMFIEHKWTDFHT